MHYDQAVEMRKAFISVGGFSDVEFEHREFWTFHSPELDNDGEWTVNLWSINAGAGNRNLTVVADYEPTAAGIALLAKKAKGTATARDKSALSRMRAEQAANRG